MGDDSVMWSIHSLFDDSWAEEWNRGEWLWPLQPRQSCLSKILESWLVELIKLWSFADVISDREGPHQPILLPKHHPSNCRSMDVCSWWRLRRQGDHTIFDRLHRNPFDSTRQVFAARLFTALKSAIKSLEKYHQALALGLPCSNSLLLPNMDQIKPSSHARLALPLKTNTDYGKRFMIVMD